MSINFFLILAQVGKIFTKKSKIRQKLIIKKVYNILDDNEGVYPMINKSRKICAILLSAVICLSLSACFDKRQKDFESLDNIVGGSAGENIIEIIEGASDEVTSGEIPTVDFEVSEKEGDVSDTSGVNILLDDENISVDGDGVSVSGGKVTITKSGTYKISGRLSCGQLSVNTADGEKVKLILNGVAIANPDGPAIYVESAPKKVIIYTAEGSVNTLLDGSDYIVPDSEKEEGKIYPNACVYSVDDLKFDGKGDIYITSNCGKGVNSKDDIEISGGNIYITSPDDGVRGNDSVEISGGVIYINSEGDGIKSANSEDEGKGYIDISGGNVSIESALDGIDAATNLNISGGNLTVKCAGGAKTTTSSSNSGMGSRPGGFPGGFGGMQEGNSNAPSYSCKALKATNQLNIGGGTITADTQDDAIHSNDVVYISGGEMTLKAGDDGIHGDNKVIIENANISVTQSYEGIEAINITVNSGTVRVTSSDDGFNACGGNSMMGGGMGGGFRPRASSTTTSEPLLTINGGYIIVNAQGDGVDSNGNIVMNGGFCIVYGPSSSMNGAIDSGDGGYCATVNGGLLLAVGTSGMAETVESDTQGVLAFSCGNVSANSLMTICDENGNIVISFVSPKIYQTVVFCTSDIVSGKEYSVYHGGENSGTLFDGIYSGGELENAEKLGSLKAT